MVLPPPLDPPMVWLHHWLQQNMKVDHKHLKPSLEWVIFINGSLGESFKGSLEVGYSERSSFGGCHWKGVIVSGVCNAKMGSLGGGHTED